MLRWRQGSEGAESVRLGSSHAELAASSADYDESALASFPPDGARAAFLNRRMIDNLARSVGEIVSGCSDAQLENSIFRLPERIRTSPRVAPEAYCIYFDLLQAVRNDDLDKSIGLLREMNVRLDAPLASFYRRWGALPDATARRYLAYVNVDPTTQINLKALSPWKYYRARQLASHALDLLVRVAPEIAAEIRSLLSEIIFISGVHNDSSPFAGATSFFCWGAMFLNPEVLRTRVAMTDFLVHESAHTFLFSLSLGEPFVENPDDELHSSPLRRDPRPLDGIFHATYVAARMHYADTRVIEAGLLPKGEENEARNARVATSAAFWKGLKTINEHARLTPLGRRVMETARDHMIEESRLSS
jgi:hypothetical protein